MNLPLREKLMLILEQNLKKEAMIYKKPKYSKFKLYVSCRDKVITVKKLKNEFWKIDGELYTGSAKKIPFVIYDLVK